MGPLNLDDSKRPPGHVPQPRSGAQGLAVGALMGFALLGSSCRNVDAPVWNLRQLHDFDGSFQRQGALLSTWEFNLRASLGPAGQREGFFSDPPLDYIEDPLGSALENLLILSSYDRDDPIIGALQIEWFSFLADKSPWFLERERCVIELGKHAKRLELSDGSVHQNLELPLATPDDLRDILTQLFEATDRVSRDPGPGATEQLIAACDAAREFQYDLDGSRRLLGQITSTLRLGSRNLASTLGALAGGGGGVDADLEPLQELSFHLQRMTVQLALILAVVDPHPLVKAAAVESIVRCFGPSQLCNFLDLLGNSQIPREDGTLPPPLDPQFTLKILALAAEYGIPELPDVVQGVSVTERHRIEFKATVLQALIVHATTDPSSRIRVAAALALKTATGGALDTLREEDWYHWWWDQEYPIWVERLEAAEAQEGTDAGSPPVEATPEQPQSGS